MFYLGLLRSGVQTLGVAEDDQRPTAGACFAKALLCSAEFFRGPLQNAGDSKAPAQKLRAVPEKFPRNPREFRRKIEHQVGSVRFLRQPVAQFARDKLVEEPAAAGSEVR